MDSLSISLSIWSGFSLGYNFFNSLTNIWFQGDFPMSQASSTIYLQQCLPQRSASLLWTRPPPPTLNPKLYMVTVLSEHLFWDSGHGRTFSTALTSIHSVTRAYKVSRSYLNRKKISRNNLNVWQWENVWVNFSLTTDRNVVHPFKRLFITDSISWGRSLCYNVYWIVAKENREMICVAMSRGVVEYIEIHPCCGILHLYIKNKLDMYLLT